MKKKALKDPNAAQKAQVAVNRAAFMDRLPKNEGEHLELMIKMTLRSIKNPVSDKFLIDQASRLEAKLVEWKRANAK